MPVPLDRAKNWSPWITAMGGPYGSDEMANQGTAQRYGTHDQKTIVNAVKQELGLGGFETKDSYGTPAVTEDGGTVLGSYHPRRGELMLTSDAQKYDPAVAAHEVSHMADSALEGYSAPTHKSADTLWQTQYVSPEMHHKYYRDFNQDFGRQLQGQAQIELGMPKDPALMRQFPWLSQVNPLSSNKLASPYAAKPTQLDADIYNMKTRDERNQDDIRAAQMDEYLRKR